jgi:hypothetical protein
LMRMTISAPRKNWRLCQLANVAGLLVETYKANSPSGHQPVGDSESQSDTINQRFLRDIFANEQQGQAESNYRSAIHLHLSSNHRHTLQGVQHRPIESYHCRVWTQQCWIQCINSS